MSHPHSAVLAVIGIALTSGSAPARGDPPPGKPAASGPIGLHVAGNCPGAEALAAALRRLLPARRVTGASATSSTEPSVTVEDRGASYRVTVGGRSRDFPDQHRDCDERVQAAAVLIALAAEPPRVSGPPAAEPREAAPGRPAPATAISLRGASPLRLDLAASVTGETSAGRNGLWTLGGSLRGALMRDRIGGSLGIGAGWSPEATYGSLRVMLVQVPLDLGFRLEMVRRGRVALFGLAGGVVALLFAEAPAITMPRSGFAADLGLRLAFEVEVDLAPRLRLELALHGRITPVPTRLEVPPHDDVGSTPIAWFGVSVGLGWNVK